MSERRERIALMLEWYVDVVSGMRDELGTGERGLQLMCRAWRVPEQGYPELDYQLHQMKGQQPNLYKHLVWYYIYSTKKRAQVCPRCNTVMHHTRNFHQHGRNSVAVVPRMLRVRQPWVRQAVVDDAVDWLEQHWRGGVFLPDELMPHKVSKDAA